MTTGRVGHGQRAISWATTDAQSPACGWRNTRAVGYQGLSSRASCQRQSLSCASNTQVGRPKAAAKCATEVSTVTTHSRYPPHGLPPCRGRP